MSMEENEKIQDSIAAVMAGGQDLREQVRGMVLRALVDRTGDPAEVREVVRHVFAGVGAGMARQGNQAAHAAREAILGLDEALGRSLYAMQMALEESWAQGREFATTDLKQTVDEIKGLEVDFLGALKACADQGQGMARDVLAQLYDHMKRNGTDTGGRLKVVLETLGNRLGRVADDVGGSVRDQARDSGERLRAVASGILRGLADSLDSRK